VFRFTEDADGTLWAGTGRGLARIRRTRADGADARLDLITARQGIPGHTVFQALDDGRGALWLTGPWGIGRVARAALHAVADGRAAAVSVAAFGRGDGMVAREASSIGRAWRAADGTLWFATPAGVAVVDPARLPSRPAAPPVLVEQVLADGAALSDGLVADTAAVRLAAGTRTIELRFAAPTFTAPERVRVRWRLEGFDPAWVDGGTRRYATYTNLPPGRYRFVVEARSGDGPWSAPAVRTLTLAPHPWQRPGVLVAAVLLACAAAASAYRWRVRVLWRQAAERATAAAREEVLREASRRDELTGLYNRRGLLALAAERVGDAGALWLLFADLDGLKAINDTLGHAAGDRALRDAADVLRATFRQSDVLARLGGDEFAVLLGAREVAAAEAAEAGGCDVAAHVVLDAARGRLADAVAIHNATAGRPYVLAMSVGASRSTGTEPGDLEALLAEADRRMYEAKRARRQRAGDAPAPPLPVPGA
jgi:diguanylate cyclase (GGDEF)-like protein